MAADRQCRAALRWTTSPCWSAARLRPSAQRGQVRCQSALSATPCAAGRSWAGPDAEKRRNSPVNWRLVESATTRPPTEEGRYGQVYRIGRARAELHFGRAGTVGAQAEDAGRVDEWKGLGGRDPGHRWATAPVPRIRDAERVAPRAPGATRRRAGRDSASRAE